MGTLRSTVNWSEMTVNGVLLGDPAWDDPMYLWDHPWLPNGEITDTGEVVPDGPTESS